MQKLSLMFRKLKFDVRISKHRSGRFRRKCPAWSSIKKRVQVPGKSSSPKDWSNEVVLIQSKKLYKFKKKLSGCQQ